MVTTTSHDGWVLEDTACFVHPDDPLTHLSAFLSHIPFLVGVVAVTLLLFTGKPAYAQGVLVLFLCMFSNKVVKGFFKHPRPDLPNGRFHSGSGMPSLHSSFVFCAAVFFARRYTDLFGPGTPILTYFRRVATAFAVATAVAWSRVYGGFHYADQVVAGACFGIVVGSLLSRAAFIISFTDRVIMPAVSLVRSW